MKNITFLFSVVPICLFGTTLNAQISLTDKLTILQKIYPDHILKIEKNKLILSNKQELVIDDGRSKNHQTKLQNPDIEDMLSQNYPLGECLNKNLQVNFDPGRIRNERLMKHLYGSNPKEIQKNLTSVNWFGQKLKFTKKHNAHKALIKVRDELAKYKALKKYLTPSAGTFNWRKISGTKRLSVHSFAAAIDINIKYAHYWRWSGDKPGKVRSYKNKVPEKIINIFENNGFIWGGKWYHYDTMHFEYRPELIAIGLKAQEKC